MNAKRICMPKDPSGSRTYLSTKIAVRKKYDVSFRVRYVDVFQTLRASSSMDLMCFLMNSKEEKKMALTTHERLMDTPSPRYM